MSFISSTGEIERILKVVSGELPKLMENIIRPLKDSLDEPLYGETLSKIEEVKSDL